MERSEFENLDLDAQVSYLNGFCEEGKDIDEICEIIGMSERELGAIGIYFLGDEFMGKPMRGYQTTKRSGNEYQTSGTKWRDEDEATAEGGAVHVPLS